MAQDSAGAGFRRGGFGYDKHVRSLQKSTLLSNADRSELSCVGVNGGQASGIYSATILRKDGSEQPCLGMSDNVVIQPGEVARIITTGGGGWGDPLSREADLVAYDVTTGLVSQEAARNSYGVVVRREGHSFAADADQTDALRDTMRKARGPLALYDRGPLYKKLLEEGRITWPEGWSNPDEGWTAFEVDA